MGVKSNQTNSLLTLLLQKLEGGVINDVYRCWLSKETQMQNPVVRGPQMETKVVNRETKAVTTVGKQTTGTMGAKETKTGIISAKETKTGTKTGFMNAKKTTGAKETIGAEEAKTGTKSANETKTEAKDGEDKSLIVRVYTSQEVSSLVNRHMELCAMQAAHSAGLAQQLHVIFTNGLVYGYAPGQVGRWALLWDDHLSRY